jgi:hypothetical protein
MGSFDHIQRCISLTDADLATAAASRNEAKALLDHMAKVAKPNEGSPKILLIFSRMATTACDWLDGELRVELVGDGEICVIEVMTELGGGLRERALPSFTVGVPLGEFVRAVERVPRMIEPLLVKTKTERRLVLVSRAERTGRSLPPAPVVIADEHLIDLPRLDPPKPVEKKGPLRAPAVPPRPGKAPLPPVGKTPTGKGPGTK